MKKQKYVKPIMLEVYEVDEQMSLLAGSPKGPVNATMDDEFVEEDI